MQYALHNAQSMFFLPYTLYLHGHMQSPHMCLLHCGNAHVSVHSYTNSCTPSRTLVALLASCSVHYTLLHSAFSHICLIQCAIGG